MCVCVRERVREKERERVRENESENERHRQTDRQTTEVTEEGPVVRNVLPPSRATEALCCHGGRDKFLNCFSSAFSPD